MHNLSSLLAASTARAKTVLAISLLAALCFSAGILKLSANNDYRAFFQADDPWLQASEHIQDTYVRNQNILLVIQNQSGELFTPEGLHCLRRATQLGWQLPHVTRVDSIANFQFTKAEGDDLIIRDLVELDAPLTPNYRHQARSTALNEPQLLKRLISEDGRTAGVNLTLHFQADSKTQQAAATAAARQWRDQLESACPNTERKLTGMVMISDAIASASKHNMIVLGTAMFWIIVLVLWLLLRSVAAVIGCILVISFSVSSGLGMAGWLGYQITPTLAVAPTMIMTMAVADCVHLLSSVRDSRRTMSLVESITHSVKLNALPIVITSLTTAIGFLGMRVADNPPLVHLGTVAAIGICAAMFFSLTLLPAWLAVSHANIPPQPLARGNRLIALSQWVAKYRIRIIWVSVLITTAMAWSASRNEASEDLVEYFKPSTEIRQATEFSLNHLTGIYQIQFSLDSGESNGVADPGYLKTLDAFGEWLLAQEEVIQVSHLGDIVKRLNQNMHGDNPDWYSLPNQRDLSAQYLLMYQFSLPFGLTLENLVTADFSASRIVATLGRASSTDILNLEAKAYAWLQQHAPQLALINGVENRGASPAMMYAHTASKIIGTMTKATFIALIGISILLCLALRSLRWGLISLIPNLIPAIVAFGIWGWINGHISMTVALVSTMTLGIVVDDTVHFLSKYLHARRSGVPAEKALSYTFSTVGVALVITTAVLVAGFFVLSLSPFAPSARMAELAMLTISSALIFDLLFLPALIGTVDKTQREETTKPSESTRL